MTVSRRRAVPLIVMLASLPYAAPGCGESEPRSSRDRAGARVEVNPPKTENFLEKVNAIKPGTPATTVRKELGNPDEVRPGVVLARPEPGPADELSNFATPGTRYQDWVYKRGDSDFHVVFTRGTRGADGVEWEVLTVRSVPRDSVD